MQSSEDLSGGEVSLRVRSWAGRRQRVRVIFRPMRLAPGQMLDWMGVFPVSAGSEISRLSHTLRLLTPEAVNEDFPQLFLPCF